jgi:hypothetical protein
VITVGNTGAHRSRRGAHLTYMSNPVIAWLAASGAWMSACALLVTSVRRSWRTAGRRDTSRE